MRRTRSRKVDPVPRTRLHRRVRRTTDRQADRQMADTDEDRELVIGCGEEKGEGT
jgi:hypothetical protein